MSDAKNNRRKLKMVFRVTITVLIIAMFVVSAVYTKKQHNWLIWCGSGALFLLVVVIIIYLFVKWLWNMRDLMTEYRETDNLLSGGLALMGVFCFVTVVMFVLSKISFFADVKGVCETTSALFVAAMPAFMGLLGVQYSVAIQERNRKQDLRLGAKPFFKIQCCKVLAIIDENKHTCHEMRIKIKLTNISQHIGIPVKILSCDSDNCESALPYTPLANNDVLETVVEVKSEKPYSDKIHIALIYKDVYENIYESKIEFKQFEKYELSETQVLYDNLILSDKEAK